MNVKQIERWVTRSLLAALLLIVGVQELQIATLKLRLDIQHQAILILSHMAFDPLEIPDLQPAPEPEQKGDKHRI